MPNKIRNLCLAVAALIIATVVSAAPEAFYLKNGDRVVFYGDSITDQRLYTTFVESYVVTRFPKLNVTFIHSGWGGDRVTGGGGGKIDLRLNRDVISYKPTVVTVMLGMNDGSYRAYEQPLFDTYSSGYEHIVTTLKSALPGLRMTLIQPSPYDDVTRPATFEEGYNSVLVRYGQFIQQLAQKQHLDVADMNTPVVAMLEKAKKEDAALAQQIIPDRVHPGPAGHLIMAQGLLEAWHAPPLVTSVEVDAAGKHVVRAEKTEVKDLAAGETIAWTQQDEALPMAFDPPGRPMSLAVKSSNVVEALNREPLRVTGLSAQQYVLTIDGETVGTFSREQLSQGINLATLATPMMKQASAVHALTLKHNTVHFDRWRHVQLAQDEMTTNIERATTAMDQVEQDLIKQQRATAQPKPHRYELSPSKSGTL
jgi:lysophospholipase L1-like esterase